MSVLPSIPPQSKLMESIVAMWRWIIIAFRKIYWEGARNLEGDLLFGAPWTKTKWLGQGVAKCPLDLFVYQEIIYETRPDLIIETGTNIGGSALFFATVFDALGRGKVWTVDKDRYDNQPKHPRIEYVVADSAAGGMYYAARDAAQFMRTMVCLDSLHTYEHVKAELELYAPLVSPGCYLVVEDTGVDEAWGKPAAKAALTEYLAEHPEFEVDESREYHLLTLNPGGWVRRKAA